MKKLYLLSAIILFIFGCAHPEEPVAPCDEEAITRIVADEDLDPAALRAAAGVANKKNPYSYKNMESAAGLLAIYWGRPVQISATHSYVRFLPKDSIQLRTLEDIYNLELFDYPIDRELSDAKIDFYRNDYVNGFCCWKYTLVPKLYWNYPAGIQKEILDEACILGSATSPRSADAESDFQDSDEELEDRNLKAAGISESDYDLIIDQSMKSAGMTPIGSGGTVCAPYAPSAQISCVDNLTNQTVRLERVKVRVNTFFNVGTGYTDADGLVTISKGWGGKFKNPVHYKAKFKTDEWKIIENTTGVAEIIGPKQKDRWYCRIQLSDRQNSCYAAIHRALVYMFYKQTEITKPGLSSNKLRVAALWDSNNNGTNGLYNGFNEYFGPLGHTLFIWGRGQSDYSSHSSIISTTLHELGHASHARYVPDLLKILLKEDKLRESYANTVEYRFDTYFYPDVSGYEFLNDLENEYTGIGAALLNQGFTMSQLEAAVRTADKYNGWKNNLIAMPDKPISADLITYLFNNPNIRWEVNLCQSSITKTPETDKNYVGEAIKFNLQQVLEQRNFKITKWSVNCSASGYTLKDTTSHSGTMIFKNPGNFVVTCDISIPGGPTYRQSIPITVEDLSQPVGDIMPRMGILTKYELAEYKFLKSWDVAVSKKVNNQNVPVSIKPEDGYYIRQKSDNGSLDIVFAQPGEYRISACNIISGKELTGELFVTVPVERFSLSGSTTYACQLCNVTAYRHNTTGEVRLMLYDGQFIRLPSNTTKLETFKTFNAMPWDSHPYYDDLAAVELHSDYGKTGGYAYWTGSIIRYNEPGPTAFLGKTVFYLYKTCHPGTIPVYAG